MDTTRRGFMKIATLAGCSVWFNPTKMKWGMKCEYCGEFWASGRPPLSGHGYRKTSPREDYAAHKMGCSWKRYSEKCAKEQA